MSISLLSKSVDGRVGVIELARPEKFNCLSMAVFRELESTLDAFEADPAVRMLLVCGQGKNFCTGAELDEVRAIRDDAAKLRAFLELGHRVLNRIEYGADEAPGTRRGPRRPARGTAYRDRRGDRALDVGGRERGVGRNTILPTS